MTNDVRHKINNLLCALSGYAEVTKGLGNLSEMQNENLTKIVQLAKEVAEVVNTEADQHKMKCPHSFTVHRGNAHMCVECKELL